MRFLLALLLSISMPVSAQQKKEDKPTIYFFVAGDSFSATGKWAASSANPKDKISMLHEVQIDCFTQWRACVVASADQYMGLPHIAVTYFEVLKWDKNGILAQTDSGICMTNVIHINFANQKITEDFSPKKLDEKKAKACAFFGGGESSSTIFVLKNSDRWNREHEKDLQRGMGLQPDK